MGIYFIQKNISVISLKEATKKFLDRVLFKNITYSSLQLLILKGTFQCMLMNSCTVYPRCSYPFYIVTYNTKWVITSWTDSRKPRFAFSLICCLRNKRSVELSCSVWWTCGRTAFFPCSGDSNAPGRPGIKGGPDPTILTWSPESNHEVFGEFSTAFVFWVLAKDILLCFILLSPTLNHAALVHMV